MSINDFAWVWTSSKARGNELLVLLAVADGAVSPSGIAARARLTMVETNQICDELVGRGELLWHGGVLRVNRSVV